jgi:hypothetical protein
MSFAIPRSNQTFGIGPIPRQHNEPNLVIEQVDALLKNHATKPNEIIVQGPNNTGAYHLSKTPTHYYLNHYGPTSSSYHQFDSAGKHLLSEGVLKIGEMMNPQTMPDKSVQAILNAIKDHFK